MTFGWTTIRKNVVRHYEVSLIRRFGHVTIRSNDFRQCRENDVRANDISGKWRSAERWFVKMTFGWTTIRENDVRLNNDSEKCRSALWSFANSTIRPCDDSVKWLSAIFVGKTTIWQSCVSAKLHFGKMMIPWNDVSGTFRKNNVASCYSCDM